jgi:hypothetical protein
VQEYLTDLNATQAAIRAGSSLKKKSNGGFYVYFLCDPRNNQIFYVGKGKGDRFRAHVKEYQKNRSCNGVKDHRIKEIIDSGLSVGEFIFEDELDERAAFSLERVMIRNLRKCGLTNIVDGIVTKEESQGQLAKMSLSRLKSYKVWANNISNETREECERCFGGVFKAYQLIKQGFEEIAAQCGDQNGI